MSASPASDLVSLKIPTPSDPELRGGNSALQASEGFVVCDAESYEFAGSEVRRIAGVVKKLEALRLSITRPMDEAKARVMDLFRKPIEDYKGARSTIEQKMLSYRAEEDRKRRDREAEQRRLADLEEQRRQDELLRQAAEAQASGDAERSQQALEEAAAPPPPPPVVVEAAPKAAGTSVRVVWKAECVNLEALVKAAAGGDQLALACLAPDPKAIGQQARALKDRLKIPGIRVWREQSMAARS